MSPEHVPWQPRTSSQSLNSHDVRLNDTAYLSSGRRPGDTEVSRDGVDMSLLPTRCQPRRLYSQVMRQVFRYFVLFCLMFCAPAICWCQGSSVTVTGILLVDDWRCDEWP